MPIHHEEAFKRGMISSKALSKLQGGGKSTISARRGPGNPTKMTDFSNKSKVDEGEGQDGPAISTKNEINAHATQKTAKVAGQTIGRTTERGGAEQKHGQKGANAINEDTGKPWPREGGKATKGRAGYGARGSDNNGGATGMKNYYGGPNNNRLG